MRVTIEHKESRESLSPSLTGLLFATVIPVLKNTVYRVNVTIQFTEEEIAIIKQRKLADTNIKFPENRIYTEQFPELAEKYGHHRSVGSILQNNGFTASFHSIPEAQQFEEQVKTQILPSLKELLVSSADYGKSQTFEV